jgi:hypothetical protein
MRKDKNIAQQEWSQRKSTDSNKEKSMVGKTNVEG